jgi:hypothetical protein
VHQDCTFWWGHQKLSLDNWQVSYEKQIEIIDRIMKRVIEYCKVGNAVQPASEGRGFRLGIYLI